jgi:hypothetical protein
MADDHEDDAELADDMAAIRAIAGAHAVGSGALASGESAEDLRSLETRVQARIARERGVLAWLCSLSTPMRLALVCGTLSLLVVAAALFLPRREDLAAYPLWRMVLTLAVFALLAAGASWRVLRPLHLPPASTRLSTMLLVLGLAIPCALAVIPLPHQGVAAGAGAQFALECGRCAGFGAVMGLPVLVLALMAGRSRIEGVVAALAGVAAGLTGNLVLQLHCPNTDVGHQLLGHWVVLLVLPIATALWCARRRG